MSAIIDPPKTHNEPPLAERLAQQYAEDVTAAAALAEQANGLPKPCASDEDLVVIGRVVVAARALSKKIDKTRSGEKEPFLRSSQTIDDFFGTMKSRLDRIVVALEIRANQYQNEKRAEAERIAREAADKAEAERREAVREALRQRQIAEEAERAGRVEEAAAAEEKADVEALRAAVVKAQPQPPTEPAKIAAEGLTVSAATEWTFEITDYESIQLDVLRPYIKREEVERALRAFVKVHHDSKALTGVKIFEAVKSKFK